MNATPDSRTARGEILDGSLPTALWGLAWRTTLQLVVINIQILVDHVMVGIYVPHVGNAAVGNAAIGNAALLFTTVIIFVNSILTGMGVLVAHFAGAGDSAKANRTVYQAFLILLVIAGLLAALGYTLSPALLNLINAAPQVQVEALPYLRIMFVFSIGMLIFFLTSEALRSAGDARTPFRLVLLMTATNILLNSFLIPFLGTLGAAIGTTTAGSVTAAYALRLLLSCRLDIRFQRPISLQPDIRIIREILRLGLPVGLQDTLRNIAALILLRFIGNLTHRAVAHAVYAVAYQTLFRLLITLPALALRDVTKTVTGQNLAARHAQRSAEAVRIARTAAIAWGFAVGLLFLAAPRYLFALFTMQDAIHLQMGQQLLLHLAIAGPCVTVALVYTGGFWGAQNTLTPLRVATLSDFIIPVGLCCYLHITDSLTASNIWRTIVFGHLSQAALNMIFFHFHQRTGKLPWHRRSRHPLQADSLDGDKKP